MTKQITALGFTVVKSQNKVKLGRMVVCDVDEANIITLGVHLPEAIQRSLVKGSSNPKDNYFVKGMGLPKLTLAMVDPDLCRVRIKGDTVTITVASKATGVMADTLREHKKLLGIGKAVSLSVLSKKLGKVNGVKVATKKSKKKETFEDTPPWDTHPTALPVTDEGSADKFSDDTSSSGVDAFLAAYG